MTKLINWRLWTILAVICITIFQIAPTIIYNVQPLDREIDEQKALKIGETLIARVEQLDKNTLNWIDQFCKDCGQKPLDIALDSLNPKRIVITANSAEQAQLLLPILSRAGANLPFGPAQLIALPQIRGDDDRVITLLRKVGYRAPLSKDDLIKYVAKSKKAGSLYLDINGSRTENLIGQVLNRHPMQSLVTKVLEGDKSAQLQLCNQALPLLDQLKPHPKLIAYFANWLFVNEDNSYQAHLQLIASLHETIAHNQKAISELSRNDKPSDDTKRAVEKNRGDVLKSEQAIKELRHFQSSLNELVALMSCSRSDGEQNQFLVESNAFIHPIFFKSDWNFADGRVHFSIHPELEQQQKAQQDQQTIAHSSGYVENWLIDEVRRVARNTGETAALCPSGFDVILDPDIQHPNFLTLDLGVFAQQEVDGTLQEISKIWKPQHQDLIPENCPIIDANAYRSLNTIEQQHCILITAPSHDRALFKGLKANAVYVIAKNLFQLKRASQFASDQSAKQMSTDVDRLNEIMVRRGFLPIQEHEPLDPRLKDSAIFELPNFAQSYLLATKEPFKILSDQRFCILPLGDIGQQLRQLNRIETEQQEDLLKWRDEYRAAQVELSGQHSQIFPPPPSNAFWENIKLSARKYLRGDSEKALKWGLDLTGGKSLRVGLYDSAGQQVTQIAALQQGRDELYGRINALGLNEIAIRIDGAHLVVDFPGSRDLSTDELICASTMSFHIVNEKFSPEHPKNGPLVNKFLDGVWNEAILTGKKDSQSLTEIARQHLEKKNSEGEEKGEDLFDSLRALGLKFSHCQTPSTSELDESISMIGSFQSDDLRGWYRQSHPLIIVFKNRALQGADLQEIQHQFEPSKGHTLSFRVKRNGASDLNSARDSLFAWTQQFAKDQIVGTSREFDRKGGWRMAVILRSSIISMPELTTPLRDGGTIAGNFSQKEVDQLARDLKAGSLTFTPKILSEENIDAQLGRGDRNRGILAAVMGFCGVLGVMVIRYRFMGAIACAALCLNLMIVAAILQNLGAALTLSGMAGLVLTMGMAVDANVLVFERMKEELKSLSPIKALRLGCRRALPAIIDSNITTALTALLLIQFDLGPIKGFAITLLSGLVSSIFTSLFVTNTLLEFWLSKKRDLSGFVRKTQFCKHLNCLPKFRSALIISALFIALGLFSGWQGRHTLVGLDFTGGTSLTVQIEPRCAQLSQKRAVQALQSSGLHSGQFNVRQLGSSENLRIELGHSINLDQWILNNSQIIAQNKIDRIDHAVKSNVGVNAVVALLENADLRLTDKCVQNIDAQWSTTSSQFSSSMKRRALMSMGIALLLSLIYLALRFEWTYALASGFGLIHTLLIAASVACYLHIARFPIEINFYVLGATMTIIGYCLNDMIIVFDRIREDRKLPTKKSLAEVVTFAIDQTLSRTLMTCGTTLIALIFLLCFGGQSLFAFSALMASGVGAGTLSSLFIATPLFHLLEKWRLQSI